MEHSVEHHGSLWNKATLMDSDDSSQCTAKASLEKGSSWPPEAIPYCHSFRVAFYYPKVPNPHLGPDLEGRWGQQLRYDLIIKKKDFTLTIETSTTIYYSSART